MTTRTGIPDSAEHALIVVDMQHDFGDPSGALYVKGAEDIIAPIAQAIADTRSAGGYVIYTQDWHPEQTPHFAAFGGLWPVHCVIESAGADLLPGIPARRTATADFRCCICRPGRTGKPNCRRCSTRTGSWR